MAKRERWLGWMAGEQAEIQRELYREQLQKVAMALEREIINSGSVDTGKLLRSIDIDYEEGRVVMRVPYADFVEYGRRPGAKMPPFNVIRTWARRKLGISDRRRVRSVAWAIMTKIHKKGIPPKYLLRKAWERVE